MKKILLSLSLIAAIGGTTTLTTSCKSKPLLEIDKQDIYVDTKFILKVNGKIKNIEIKIDGDMLQVSETKNDKEFEILAKKSGKTTITLAGETYDYWFTSHIGKTIISHFHWVYHENLKELEITILDNKGDMKC